MSQLKGNNSFIPKESQSMMFYIVFTSTLLADIAVMCYAQVKFILFVLSWYDAWNGRGNQSTHGKSLGFV